MAYGEHGYYQPPPRGYHTGQDWPVPPEAPNGRARHAHQAGDHGYAYGNQGSMTAVQERHAYNQDVSEWAFQDPYQYANGYAGVNDAHYQESYGYQGATESAFQDPASSYGGAHDAHYQQSYEAPSYDRQEPASHYWQGHRTDETTNGHYNREPRSRAAPSRGHGPPNGQPNAPYAYDHHGKTGRPGAGGSHQQISRPTATQAKAAQNHTSLSHNSTYSIINVIPCYMMQWLINHRQPCT